MGCDCNLSGDKSLGTAPPGATEKLQVPDLSTSEELARRFIVWHRKTITTDQRMRRQNIPLLTPNW
jgi:hypothetical protein